MGIPLLSLLAGACRPPEVTFPAGPIARTAERADYDTDGNGRADFFCLFDAAGRIDRIAYDRDGDGRPDHLVHLDALDPRLCRHLVLVLDGIPFDVAREFHQAGNLRLFPPPAVVIPPYPVMTDLALEDAFGYVPCAGFEAKYYDRSRGKVVGGAWDYLLGRNEPFARIIAYRASTLYDALAYLKPAPVFAKELADAKRLWDRRKHMEMVAYFVSSAALGSRQAKEGQLHALRECERLMLQVLMESHGLVKFTFFADHGQTNVLSRPAGLGKHLKDRGWRLTKRLRADDEAVLIKYGLVTYAAFNTRRPGRLAEDLLASDAVELVSYVEGDEVVVRTRDAHAAIRSPDGKTFQYRRLRGDPLKLESLAGEQADGREVLKATADGKHQYPDALYRLWRAHFALVENPPDVIACLKDAYHNGEGFFADVVTMASTHGGLNWRNSATFLMSTAGRVQGPLRSEDLPALIGSFFARPFPARF